MNEATIKKLKLNPHYKMSAKQKEEAREKERKPMVEFGAPQVHQNRNEPQFENHPTNVVKRERNKKNET